MRDGWSKRKLGDVLEIQNGCAFDSKRFSATTGMPLIRIRDLKGGHETETRYDGDYEEKYVVNAGDLLVGMDGEFGCYEWAGPPALLNQRVCRLQKFHPEVLPRFVRYGVNSHLKDIEDVTAFATVKHLSSKQILEIDFPTPPLAEQRRIVGILDVAFDGIAKAKATAETNLKNARAIFESRAADIFALLAPRESPALGEVCKRVSVGHVGVTAPHYRSTGVLFLRTQNVTKDGLRMDDVKFITEDFHKALRKSQVHGGDVLLSRVITDSVNCAIVPDGLGPMNCANVVLVRPGANLLSKFLMYYVRSRPGQKHLLARRVGSAQLVVNTTVVKEWPIPLPSTAEQELLIAQLDSLTEATKNLESIYLRKLAALDDLKRSLLHHAFAGSL